MIGPEYLQIGEHRWLAIHQIVTLYQSVSDGSNPTYWRINSTDGRNYTIEKPYESFVLNYILHRTCRIYDSAE